MPYAPFTLPQARHAGIYLLKFRGIESVEVVENLSTGSAYVRFVNACGSRRVLASSADLIEIKETELVNLAMR